MSNITIPPAALEAGARAMAKAGYAFSGIELTDPYTADADYWDCCARAACLAMLEAWPGMHQRTGIKQHESGEWREPYPMLCLPLPQENPDDKA